MSTIEDLNIPSITDMGQDEAIEYLRQLRLSRRIPVKTQSKTTTQKKKQSKAVPKMSKEQAAELLKLLEG
jgi:hypothetical protein